eukprot:465167-Rhodomonas_salina.5
MEHKQEHYRHKHTLQGFRDRSNVLCQDQRRFIARIKGVSGKGDNLAVERNPLRAHLDRGHAHAHRLVAPRVKPAPCRSKPEVKGQIPHVGSKLSDLHTPHTILHDTTRRAARSRAQQPGKRADLLPVRRARRSESAGPSGSRALMPETGTPTLIGSDSTLDTEIQDRKPFRAAPHLTIAVSIAPRSDLASSPRATAALLASHARTARARAPLGLGCRLRVDKVEALLVNLRATTRSARGSEIRDDL